MLFTFRKACSLLIGMAFGNALLRFSGVRCAGLVRCFGVPFVELRKGGRICIGRGGVLKSSQVASFMGLNTPCKFSALQSGAEIVIGRDFQASACVICSRQLIRIGDRVMLGANTTILDSDCHSLDPVKRQTKDCDIRKAQVVIEDDVFVGMNSIILKGVTIGRGTVIAAGSVVTHSIPEYCLAGGNPAVVIKKL